MAKALWAALAAVVAAVGSALCCAGPMNSPSKVIALASLSLLGTGVFCPPCRNVLAQFRTPETGTQAAQAARVKFAAYSDRAG